MEAINTLTVRQWLSLEQISELLSRGELTLDSPNGSVRLYVNFCDRSAACQLSRCYVDLTKK